MIGGNPAREEPLAPEFSVSRATVRSALADLETTGLIRRVHGKGSFPVSQGRVHMLLSATTYLERLKQTSTEFASLHLRSRLSSDWRGAQTPFWPGYGSIPWTRPVICATRTKHRNIPLITLAGFVRFQRRDVV
ncbi:MULTISPECIES: GntR family transcriptional regulator [Paraburkholderia]|uniref:GntR family transcriptional regulator n=1 Tax=Paraburkholderia unamae TaxID=219649 RepID=A0ACC6REK9_9BURK